MAKAISRADRLTCAIIAKAVEDWRLLVKTDRARINTYHGDVSIKELRAFFTGPWCALLMHGMAVTPEQVLDRLEQELAGEASPPVEKYITTPSTQIIAKIARLREKGKTWHAISRTMGVHWTTARAWYERGLGKHVTTGKGH